MFWEIFLIAIVISIIVLIASVVTISKAYSYEHKVDPIPDKDLNSDQSKKENSTD